MDTNHPDYQKRTAAQRAADRAARAARRAGKVAPVVVAPPVPAHDEPLADSTWAMPAHRKVKK